MHLPARPSSPADQAQATCRAVLTARFEAVRAHSLALAAPLSAEDQCVQSMPDASPTKWHLAHTTWFFEALVLDRLQPGYAPYDRQYFYLFNSYYEALGPRHPRPQRGLLTRPALSDVHAYRHHVDAAMRSFIAGCDAAQWDALLPIVTLGLHHEQQHQELLLTDALHMLSCNPMLPAYTRAPQPALRLAAPAPSQGWVDGPGGLAVIGSDAADGRFRFDNETPRHRVHLAPYRIARQLVTCGDYARFIADGGYLRPELWLSDGWSALCANGWRAPAYWVAADDPRAIYHAERNNAAAASLAGTGDWLVYGLHGLRPMDTLAPVAQLSFYEASAYAEWAGARLPTEFEWEAASALPGLDQLTGHVWQWTRSSYDPYPGFRPLPGLAAEYNGKFMVGQLVLRGGSVATPDGHTRSSYRNFFPPGARWQFSGLRLAQDA